MTGELNMNYLQDKKIWGQMAIFTGASPIFFKKWSEATSCKNISPKMQSWRKSRKPTDLLIIAGLVFSSLLLKGLFVTIRQDFPFSRAFFCKLCNLGERTPFLLGFFTAVSQKIEVGWSGTLGPVDILLTLLALCWGITLGATWWEKSHWYTQELEVPSWLHDSLEVKASHKCPITYLNLSKTSKWL